MTSDFDPLDTLGDDPIPLPIPFAWADLPRERSPARSMSSVGTAADWSLALDSGRVIRLSTLSQYLTYAGLLAGLPDETNHASQVEWAVRKAESLHGAVPARVQILPPVLVRITVKSRRDGGPEPVAIDVDHLPHVSCVARFDSGPVGEGDEAGSFLDVVWFQGAFGPPEPGAVTDRLKALPWDTCAQNWDW